MFVIRVTLQDGSDYWYVHKNGERIKSKETAVRYSATHAIEMIEALKGLGLRGRIDQV